MHNDFIPCPYPPLPTCPYPPTGAEIGDIFISTAKVHHDRRIPIPGFDAYGVGSVPSVPTPRLLASMPSLKTGVVSTGNSLDYTDK